MIAIYLAACVTMMTSADPELLCERVQFAHNLVGGGPELFFNYEPPTRKEARASLGVYSLSSVTVPLGGWKIDSIAIYVKPDQGCKWTELRRARLNVFAKKAERPAEGQAPWLGREVDVKVREILADRVFEMRVSDLLLDLDPGEYWIGLTPICPDISCKLMHVLARDVNDARFEDVYRRIDKEAPPEDAAWATIYPDRPGEHLSIRIYGWRVQRGRLIDWPEEAHGNLKQIHLRYGSFDPLVAPPQISRELKATESETLWIVQFHDTVDQTARDDLAKLGVRLLRYIPEDAYIVRIDSEDLDQVRRLPGVRWVGAYHPAYRLDPNVFEEPTTRNFSLLAMRSQASEAKGWRNTLIHLFNREEGAKNLVAKVVRDAGGEVVFQSPRGLYLAANVPLDRLAAVARCDVVCAIERRFGAFELRPHAEGNEKTQPAGYSDEKNMVTLSQIRDLSGADAVKKAGGYEGLGVRVAFWDLGLRVSHVDLLARPLAVYGPPWLLTANHGTQVASILCGEGRGDTRARGLLPLGGLAFAVDQGDPAHEDRYGLVERFIRDHRIVVLSSSSSNWGGGAQVKHYDGYSLLLDDLVSAHDLLICEAIGNSTGSGNGMSGSWAKNALVVGGVDPKGSLAREDHRPGAFTSGPALDGRVKPDMVHFGRNVYCADASSSRGYGLFGGTSCAAPLVAGHCGLMMEMWADGVFGNFPLGSTVFDRKPHAATAKALMINSAYRYTIEGAKPVFTRFNQGWGMPDLGQLYKTRKEIFVVDQDVLLRDHKAVEYQLIVPENQCKLSATLVYTDPLGATSASKSLVNDLDLVVVSPDGRRYHGNNGLLHGDISVEGGSLDRINNVENVLLDRPGEGVWRVVVAARRIAWGQRGDAKDWGQDFSLVVSGVNGHKIPAQD